MGDKGPQPITTDDLFAGKKVVLFAVPGAFTPGCSNTHLPGFVVNADKIKAKGVASIVCVSVNDAFVMGAWGKAQNAEHLIMLADGSAELAKATGMELDLTDKGMGVRWKRLAMIVDNGVVKNLAIEPPGGIVESSAEAILKLL
jgi:peroxiredoxin